MGLEQLLNNVVDTGTNVFGGLKSLGNSITYIIMIGGLLVLVILIR